ncbi:MAG: hypothetical protein QM727_12075 [Niabella sp.]
MIPVLPDCKKRAYPEQFFAMAQYQEMKNEAKLSRSFIEKEKSGVELSVAGQQVTTGRAVRRVVRYELIVIDNNFKRFICCFMASSVNPVHPLPAQQCCARLVLSKQYKTKLSPYTEKIVAGQAGYYVADNTNNKAYGRGTSFTSEAQAREFMNQQIAADPSLRIRYM